MSNKFKDTSKKNQDTIFSMKKHDQNKIKIDE